MKLKKSVLTVVGGAGVVRPPHLSDEKRRPADDIHDDDDKRQFDRLQLGAGETAEGVGTRNHGVRLTSGRAGSHVVL